MTTAVHGGDHNVSFDLDARHGWLLSEPTPLEPILNGGDFQEEMHIRLRDESRLSDRVNAALVHLTNTVIDVVSKRGAPLAARGILRRLCLDIPRVYPNFSEPNAILDASVPTGEQVSTSLH